MIFTNLLLDQTKHSFIYLTTNLVSGKRYVGKRVIKGTDKDSIYLGSGKILRNAIEKGGADNFYRQILAYCDNNELLAELETFCIEELSVLWPIGYNIAKQSGGGDLISHHPNKDEIYRRQSAKRRGMKFSEQ